MRSLDGTTFQVSATASQGVVSSETTLALTQRGARVLGRYSGGSIKRGCLVGAVDGSTMVFRYAQREAAGGIHGGHSACKVLQLADGRLRLEEHFTWDTRPG